MFLVFCPLAGSPKAAHKFGLFLCWFLLGCAVLFPAEATGDYAAKTVKLVVYGPSDEIFIWWGHAAIAVEYENGAAFTYDWGIFDYPGDDFLAAFFQNQVKYRSAKSYTRYDMESYFAEDRDIVVYTLDLDEAGKEAMIRYAEEDVLPENCWYDYDDFTNNCSTGIRDLIDLGTGGQLRAWAENEKGRFTLRQHIRRFMAFHPWVDWYTSFLIGRMLDRETTAWDEMFLPVEVGRHIRDFSLTGTDGEKRKLVTHAELLNQSKTRQSVLNSPPDELARSFIAGMFIALLFVWAARNDKHKRALRITSGILQSAAGLFFGLFGLAVLLAPVFAGNEYLAHNNNALFVNPVLLMAVPLGILSSLGKNIRLGKRTLPAEKALRVLWTYMLLAVLAALLLNLSPSLRQANGSPIVFTLPIVLAFVFGDIAVPFKKR
ncbi:MAG: DUF4105 domain-containing protein [Spirochaetaceae bacterium]|jgi:hypothetical protein|nr:DUF4105 domain-containing protein [Spirochaetaceae bacterium]